MLILKRLSVWFVEISSEVVLLGLVLTVLLGHDQHAFFKDLSIYSSGIILLSVTTGYLLSTIVVRAVWRGRTLWSYPTIATVLFFIHFEIMNVGLSGAFEPSVRVRIRAAGACIVFACTLAGTFALRKWAPARSKLAESQP
jgi:intracellular septation protein A